MQIISASQVQMAFYLTAAVNPQAKSDSHVRHKRHAGFIMSRNSAFTWCLSWNTSLQFDKFNLLTMPLIVAEMRVMTELNQQLFEENKITKFTYRLIDSDVKRKSSVGLWRDERLVQYCLTQLSKAATALIETESLLPSSFSSALPPLSTEVLQTGRKHPGSIAICSWGNRCSLTSCDVSGCTRGYSIIVVCLPLPVGGGRPKSL